MKPFWQNARAVACIFLGITLLLIACEAVTTPNPTTYVGEDMPEPDDGVVFEKVGTIYLLSHDSPTDADGQRSYLATGSFKSYEDGEGITYPKVALEACYINGPLPSKAPTGDLFPGQITLNKASDGSVYTPISLRVYFVKPPTSTYLYWYENDDPISEPTGNLDITVSDSPPTNSSGSVTFPDFGTLPMPPVPSDFKLTTSADDLNKINTDTVLTWTGNGSKTGYMEFNFSNLTCYAKDDGSFTFPEIIKDILGSQQFSLQNASRKNRKRLAHPTETEDALLVLTSTRSKNFMTSYEE